MTEIPLRFSASHLRRAQKRSRHNPLGHLSEARLRKHGIDPAELRRKAEAAEAAERVRRSIATITD